MIIIDFLYLSITEDWKQCDLQSDFLNNCEHFAISSRTICYRLKQGNCQVFPMKLLLVLRTGTFWSLAVPLPAFSLFHGPAWCPCSILGCPGEVFLGDEGDVGFVPWVNGSKGGHGDTGPCSLCLWLYPSHPSVLQLHAQLPGCLGQGEHTRHWQGLQKSLFFCF